MKRLLVCVYLWGVATGLFSQNTDNETSVSVQIRPRAEYRNGVLSPRNEGDLSTGFVTNRARIALVDEYRAGKRN